MNKINALGGIITLDGEGLPAAVPMGFVKWDCGCKGLRLETGSICLKACDGDGDPMFGARDFADKSFVSLDPTEIAELTSAISNLINDGYRLREIKRALA